MSEKLDDLEAVRVLVKTLEPFDAYSQERIIRWASEKLGLLTTSTASQPAELSPSSVEKAPRIQHHEESADIRSFIAQKNPSSDTEFAAAVAYYYRFEAPPAERKDSITSQDIQSACRLAGRARIGKPSQTLVNAHYRGVLDKAGERGAYSINTVGENLVAMALPSDGSSSHSMIPVRRKAATKSASTKGAKNTKAAKTAKG